MDWIDGVSLNLRCDFCLDKISDPKDAVAGSSSFICRNCASLIHNDTMHKQRIQEEIKVTSTKIRDDIKRPVEIMKELNEYLIGQKEAKQQMCVAVYHHYLRVKKGLPAEGRNNIMLIGPTGCGKTYIMTTIAKIIGLPLCVYDCTGLTEAGYVGKDVEDILVSLLTSSGGNPELASKGIVFVDEIDKKADRTNPGTGRDVSGKSVQQSLLKMIEGGLYNVKYNDKSVKINTGTILFVFGGAFSDLVTYSIAEKKSNSIGFHQISEVIKEVGYQDIVDRIDHRDLIKYGMLAEFIGRVPIIVKMQKLKVNELRQILTDVKNSVVSMVKEIFEADGIKVNIPEETLTRVAEVAFNNESGARGLRTIIEHSLFEQFFELPGTQTEEFTFTPDMVVTLK